VACWLARSKDEAASDSRLTIEELRLQIEHCGLVSLRGANLKAVARVYAPCATMDDEFLKKGGAYELS
jgi:hypothetical protein